MITITIILVSIMCMYIYIYIYVHNTYTPKHTHAPHRCNGARRERVAERARPRRTGTLHNYTCVYKYIYIYIHVYIHMCMIHLFSSLQQVIIILLYCDMYMYVYIYIYNTHRTPAREGNCCVVVRGSEIGSQNGSQNVLRTMVGSGTLFIRPCRNMVQMKLPKVVSSKPTFQQCIREASCRKQ